MLTMLALSALAADDHSTLEGRRCDAAGTCSSYAMHLHEGSRLVDSLGRSGTYTLVAGSAGRVLTYDFPDDRVRGTLTEGPDLNCFDEDGPAPHLNLCFAVDDLQLLRPYSSACEAVALDWTSALEGEEGHWAAGRLTAQQAGGMWVHQVQYYMNTGSGNCGSLDHQVQVFLGDAALPPANTPAVLHTFPVDGDTLPAGDFYRSITLPAPVFVPDGESLFVSVEMTAVDQTEVTCLAACTSGPLQGDQSYWSNSATMPYAWQDLNDWGIPEVMIRARVLYAAP